MDHALGAYTAPRGPHFSRARGRLSDRKYKGAKPEQKPYKISDGKGLYLLVNPNGSKLWKQK